MTVASIRLGDVARILPSVSTSSDGEFQVSTVTSGCLTPIGFEASGIRLNRMSADAIRDSAISEGEVLVSRSNTEGLVGRAATYLGEPTNLHAGDLVLRIQPGDSVDPEFLGYYLAWLQLRGFWRARSNGASSTMKKITRAQLSDVRLPDLSVDAQREVATRLRHELVMVGRIVERLASIGEASIGLIEGALRTSLATSLRVVTLSDVLVPVTERAGADWKDFDLLGASTRGLMAGKERPGKRPASYKRIRPGTIFYNPMRILIGSIAYVRDEPGGITTPEYVAFRTIDSSLDFRWFYWWLRSWRGAALIKSLARGAVRERLLFPRLSAASIELPPIDAQRLAAESIEAATQLGSLAEQQSDLASELPSVLLARELSKAAR